MEDTFHRHGTGDEVAGVRMGMAFGMDEDTLEEECHMVWAVALRYVHMDKITLQRRSADKVDRGLCDKEHCNGEYRSLAF